MFPFFKKKLQLMIAKKLYGIQMTEMQALAQVETEKRFAIIKAWEDSEKTKADNKACKKLYATEAWENIKIAYIKVELKQIEEHFEKKRAAYVEKMKNKMAEIHKSAEEKRAVVVAKKREDELEVEAAAESSVQPGIHRKS